MAPRIDPALPLVWRSPTELQLGGEFPRVVITDPGPLETGLISALRHGASLETVRMIGAGLDGSPAEVERTLARLAPAFEPLPGEPGEPDGPDGSGGAAVQHPSTMSAVGPAAPPLVVIDAAAPFATRIAALLAQLGYATTPPGETDGDADAPTPALAVIAAHWVVPPARYLPWLRADVPHLAVVDDERGWRIGPLVEPGRGPCLRCTELARRDRDAAWPVIAAQLAGHPAPRRPRGIRDLFDAAVAAARVVDDRLREGDASLAAASITTGGQASPTEFRVHPECGCRAPAGSATAPARLAGRRPGAPSSAAGVAVPA